MAAVDRDAVMRFLRPVLTEDQTFRPWDMYLSSTKFPGKFSTIPTSPSITITGSTRVSTEALPRSQRSPRDGSEFRQKLRLAAGQGEPWVIWGTHPRRGRIPAACFPSHVCKDRGRVCFYCWNDPNEVTPGSVVSK